VLPAVLPRASKLAVAGRATLVPAGDRANDMPVRALPAVDGRDGAMRAPAIVAMMSSLGRVVFAREAGHPTFENGSCSVP